MSRTLRVLLIEDDAAQRHMLRLSLEKRGHQVAGEIARGDDDAIVGCSADVAVVDLGLPGRSGVDVTRVLRARDVPVLVVSASAHSATVTEALLAGALGYIVKGARLGDIVDAVECVARREQVIPASAREPSSRQSE